MGAVAYKGAVGIYIKPRLTVEYSITAIALGRQAQYYLYLVYYFYFTLT